MFTVKFIGVDDNNRHIERFISCDTFSLIKTEDTYEISLQCGDMGVAYRISKDESGGDYNWSACFIENQAGKTIHALRSSDFYQLIRRGSRG